MMLAKRGLTWILRSRTVNSAVRALARARGHSLVLVYHRVALSTSPDCDIVPTVSVDVFRAHLQALGEVAELVTLDELLATRTAGRVADASRMRLSIAVTLDDDLPSHVIHALPILREVRVPAAFFLSGRALHRLGPYWFQQLEALLLTRGARKTAALLGIPSATPATLALACEQSRGIRRRVGEVSADVRAPSTLEREDIASLSAARMTIGFHTLDHAILPGMDDTELAGAVAHGRTQLAAAAGAAVRFFAYPHGKVDARSARAVRDGGFEAAFTGRPEALRRRNDRYAIGRWEPGSIGVDDFLVKLAMYLHRPILPVAATEVQPS
jgi:peptidoglycan/xylan/chitin deacetylase (PgdA/CDA1 family)